MLNNHINLLNKKSRFRASHQAIFMFLRFWQALNLDVSLLFGILLLASTGLFILYSASGGDLSSVFHQAILMFFGCIVMCVCAKISPRSYKKLALWLYVFFLVMLVIVLVTGVISKGAQRWLNIGFFRFQPSESLKLIMPLFLASYLHDKTLPPNLKVLGTSMLLIIVPVFLVAIQPDLGTAIMTLASGLAILIFVGIRLKFFLFSLATVFFSLPVLWHFMHAYQRARVLTFLNPERDPLGSGYHIIQSKIAIGSGGFFGKGWLKGSQSQLQFLPEHATDFIFAVLGEEFGFIGVIIFFALSLFIVGRGLYISSQAQDNFSRLLAAGLSLMFFFSFFVNVGMVIGILPVVGLPLPLTSYGGSSVLTLMIGFGVIMSMRAHQKLLPS